MTHENIFGMFIHWGFYSLTGIQEQAIARFDLDSDEYEKLMYKFDPRDYDPEKWVLLAKRAGMKYICFTAKHHDGFCMWDTKYTDYNIMNTPYGKDVLKMLSEACKKYGMKLSLYYSIPDWHCPYAYNPASTHQWKCRDKINYDTLKYREYVKNQVSELLTNYGEIYTFFWDIPPKIFDPSLNELVRKLQPGIFINNRGYDDGDFSTPEREYEGIGEMYFTKMTEACNSLGEQSWGFRREEDFYTKRHITCAIDRYMAMGASYLLNVGPDERGVITEDYEKRLLAVGDWYLRMEGILESAEPDEYDYEIRKNKYIATKKNGKTYIHFYEGLESSAVSLVRYPNMPKSVRLMNDGKELPFRMENMPEFFDIETGKAYADLLHIYNIPTEDLYSEPIVIEIEF